MNPANSQCTGEGWAASIQPGSSNPPRCGSVRVSWLESAATPPPARDESPASSRVGSSCGAARASPSRVKSARRRAGRQRPPSPANLVESQTPLQRHRAASSAMGKICGPPAITIIAQQPARIAPAQRLPRRHSTPAQAVSTTWGSAWISITCPASRWPVVKPERVTAVAASAPGQRLSPPPAPAARSTADARSQAATASSSRCSSTLSLM
jgi:hypothetical protein